MLLLCNRFCLQSNIAKHWDTKHVASLPGAASKQAHGRSAHLLIPPLVIRALPSVRDIFILAPLLRACWDTVKGGFHSTKHLGPWGDPSSEITSTCSTPAQQKPLARLTDGARHVFITLSAKTSDTDY